MKTKTQGRFVQITGAVLLLTVALALPAFAQHHSWDGWERGRGNGAFELDGTFIGMQQGCALIREHTGKVIPLLGNPGDLQKGDHLLFSGQIQGRSSCGPAFRVGQVLKLWADGTHKYVIYDRARDGDYVARNGWWDRYNRDHYGRH